jgi:hypothetical protein
VYYFDFVFSQQIQNLKNFKKNYQNFWIMQKSYYGLPLDFHWSPSIRSEPHNLWLLIKQSIPCWVHEEKKKNSQIFSERFTEKFFLKCVILTIPQSLNLSTLKTFWFVFFVLFCFIIHFFISSNKDKNESNELICWNKFLFFNHWTCFFLCHDVDLETQSYFRSFHVYIGTNW